MKKKIVILGSTGSIGKSLINIIKKDKKKFDIVLLTAEKNYSELLKQAKLFKVKNLIISDKKKYLDLIKKKSVKDLKIYNNFDQLGSILKKKIDYSMCAISGINGLEPSLKIIKYSKKLALANKESIICGWNLIKKELKKNKTQFLPVDSEHFSIWSLIDKESKNIIDKVFITASGGPFLKWPLSKIKNATPKNALKHPNWSMGKKISIDSATMMNKVFEVIETQKIFNLPKEKIEILIHEKSYVHAIVEFKNGLKKLLAHDTNMRIPIFNTLYHNTAKTIKSNSLDIKKFNNLNFRPIDKKKFPSIKVLNRISNKDTMFETVLVSANDELVNLFLNKKISFNQIIKNLMKIINLKEFRKFRNKKPRNIKEIYTLNNSVRLKIRELCI